MRTAGEKGIRKTRQESLSPSRCTLLAELTGAGATLMTLQLHGCAGVVGRASSVALPVSIAEGARGLRAASVSPARRETVRRNYRQGYFSNEDSVHG